MIFIFIFFIEKVTKSQWTVSLFSVWGKSKSWLFFPPSVTFFLIIFSILKSLSLCFILNYRRLVISGTFSLMTIFPTWKKSIFWLLLFRKLRPIFSSFHDKLPLRSNFLDFQRIWKKVFLSVSFWTTVSRSLAGLFRSGLFPHLKTSCWIPLTAFAPTGEALTQSSLLEADGDNMTSSVEPMNLHHAMLRTSGR